MTDELTAYKKIGKNFASHETVIHSNYEYVRGDVYTNTVEGFFSLLKRGINGVYHHVSKEHLHRTLLNLISDIIIARLKIMRGLFPQ